MRLHFISCCFESDPFVFLCQTSILRMYKDFYKQSTACKKVIGSQLSLLTHCNLIRLLFLFHVTQYSQAQAVANLISLQI